ncbi:TetR/AcrR family transcriptional regulator [Cellulomonas soli]|uniref:TetR family transcriptional regulator n=1 Tax=Cellulomonas soli TaxID=931535 RepID=A0A512PC98_9CELL|nr:TetR/AcrR family transcriptional regulator [Cellulomonas soli]NYI58411.1 AcrR family transcriptional regulator [Cellulomonas soli]GEP68833.1 TetR family transcriptional regulator [Cellulomonas soli]
MAAEQSPSVRPGPLGAVGRDAGAALGTGRRGLSADRVVEAAVALADAEGLAAVSMSNVARRLGSAPMSLYRHVADKDELLLRMHDTVWRSASAPEVTGAPDGPGWRARLSAWCHAQRAVLLAHPWLEEIRLAERAGTPSQLVWLDRGFACLEGTGLAEHDKADALLLLSGFVLWEARWRAETAVPADEVNPLARDFGGTLRGVVDARTLPSLRRALEAGALDAPGSSYGTFEFGLGRILDGIEALEQGSAADA